jgi:hypothetical protein
MTVIKVTNCQICPFVDYESGYGYIGCNLNTDIIANQMPSDKVHDDCPLKNGEVTVKFKP